MGFYYFPFLFSQRGFIIIHKMEWFINDVRLESYVNKHWRQAAKEKKG